MIGFKIKFYLFMVIFDTPFKFTTRYKNTDTVVQKLPPLKCIRKYVLINLAIIPKSQLKRIIKFIQSNLDINNTCLSQKYLSLSITSLFIFKRIW